MANNGVVVNNDDEERKDNADTVVANNNNNNPDAQDDVKQEAEAAPLLRNMAQDIEELDASIQASSPQAHTSSSRISVLLKLAAITFLLICCFLFVVQFFFSDDADSDTLHHHHLKFYQQAQDFLGVYDAEVATREQDTTYETYAPVIADDNPSQQWLQQLHIGSLVDALDVESKWYTGYVTNIDAKSSHTVKVKVHYDDWEDRFDEWIELESGKLAPYRTHAIGGRFQNGLPGRPALPIKTNTTTSQSMSAFHQMRVSLWRRQQSVPDVRIQIMDTQSMVAFAAYLDSEFFDLGVVHCERSLYMNKYGIYIFYSTSAASAAAAWCVGPNYNDADTAFICIADDALRPELIMGDGAHDIRFKKIHFSPAYLQSRASKAKNVQPIGEKGLHSIPRLTLNNQVMLPMVSVGTAGLSYEAQARILDEAVKAGYYMFDTGVQSMQKPVYYNHVHLQRLFRVYGRHMIGVSTKVPASAHGYHATIRNLMMQLDSMATDYFDLVLIEHPDCTRRDNEACEGHWLDTWRALEHLYNKKRIRALGVSQFNVQHLKILMRHKQKHIPLSVVRDWRDPLHPNLELLNWCKQNNVHCQAFGALGGQHLSKSNVLTNPVLINGKLKHMAEKYAMTVAQLIIKWNIQKGVGVVLRTNNTQHLDENLDSFALPPLSKADLQAIDHLLTTHSSPTAKREPLRFTVPGDGSVQVQGGGVINEDKKKRNVQTQQKQKQMQQQQQQRRQKDRERERRVLPRDERQAGDGRRHQEL